MRMKKLISIALALTVILASGCAKEVSETPEQACVNSGGTVGTGMCCKSVGDFPDTCAVGACACPPDNSHEVKICDCGEGRCYDGNTCVPAVHSFQECVEAGYPVMESYPPQCKTPDGRTFTEGEEHCIAPTGESMSLFEAKEIAVNSECGDNLKEPYLEFSMCNADTGTWWIDLDLEKEGCNPACVVDIKTKTAEINWRCTGVIPIVTEEAVPPSAGQTVVCWYGHVVSLPAGAQFDDYLVLEPEGAGEIGVEGANAEIEAEIQGLRDKEEPGGYAHFWGTVTCPALDYGGCQLLVTRLRPEGPEGPFFDPDPVEGWEGQVFSVPGLAQFDDYFVLDGPFGVQYGIEGADEALMAQLEDFRDTSATIWIWGEIQCGIPDTMGCSIRVERCQLVSEESPPLGVHFESPVVGWYGRVVGLPADARYDDYLHLLPEGAGDVGLTGADASVKAEIEGLRDSDTPAHFWGAITCGVTDYDGCQATITRIIPEGAGPYPDPDPVEGWEGRYFFGADLGEFDDCFIPDFYGPFGVRYGIQGADEALQGALEELRNIDKHEIGRAHV